MPSQLTDTGGLGMDPCASGLVRSANGEGRCWVQRGRQPVGTSNGWRRFTETHVLSPRRVAIRIGRRDTAGVVGFRGPPRRVVSPPGGGGRVVRPGPGRPAGGNAVLRTQAMIGNRATARLLARSVTQEQFDSILSDQDAGIRTAFVDYVAAVVQRPPDQNLVNTIREAIDSPEELKRLREQFRHSLKASRSAGSPDAQSRMLREMATEVVRGSTLEIARETLLPVIERLTSETFGVYEPRGFAERVHQDAIAGHPELAVRPDPDNPGIELGVGTKVRAAVKAIGVLGFTSAKQPDGGRNISLRSGQGSAHIMLHELVHAAAQPEWDKPRLPSEVWPMVEGATELITRQIIESSPAGTLARDHDGYYEADVTALQGAMRALGIERVELIREYLGGGAHGPEANRVDDRLRDYYAVAF
jgi:hypothetical protein